MPQFVGGATFPDHINPETLDEIDARNIIGNIGTIRKRLNDPEKVWAMHQLFLFMKSSPWLSCKKHSTTHLGPYFSDVPTMQEAATDVVYDLCEHDEAEVRILGYSTLPQLVRRNFSWTARNTDVLVQLLQIDEERELAVIRTSIEKCISDNPTDAIPVLCDYAVANQPQSHNTSLRASVLNYMTTHLTGCIDVALKAHPEAIAPFTKAITAVIAGASAEEALKVVDRVLCDVLRDPPENPEHKKDFRALSIGVVSTLVQNARLTLPSSTTTVVNVHETTSYLEGACVLASLPNLDDKPALDVLGFLSDELLQSVPFWSSANGAERFTIASMAIELYMSRADILGSRLPSAILVHRGKLSRCFDKLSDALLAGGLTGSGSEEKLRRLHAVVVSITIPACITMKQSLFPKHLQLVEQAVSSPAFRDRPEAVQILASIQSLDRLLSRPFGTPQPTPPANPPSVPAHSSTFPLGSFSVKRKAPQSSEVSTVQPDDHASLLLQSRGTPIPLAEDASGRSAKRSRTNPGALPLEPAAPQKGKDVSLLQRVQISSPISSSNTAESQMLQTAPFIGVDPSLVAPKSVPKRNVTIRGRAKGSPSSRRPLIDNDSVTPAGSTDAKLEALSITSNSAPTAPSLSFKGARNRPSMLQSQSSLAPSVTLGTPSIFQAAKDIIISSQSDSTGSAFNIKGAASMKAPHSQSTSPSALPTRPKSALKQKFSLSDRISTAGTLSSGPFPSNRSQQKQQQHQQPPPMSISTQGQGLIERLDEPQTATPTPSLADRLGVAAGGKSVSKHLLAEKQRGSSSLVQRMSAPRGKGKGGAGGKGK